MVAKASRDQILKRLLHALIDVWGYEVVLATVQSLQTSSGGHETESRKGQGSRQPETAVTYATEIATSPERKKLIIHLAEMFDRGTAFPTLSDIRSFLKSHQLDARDLKSRSHAFKKMLPVLVGMSEKGLEKVISRSHHSGPAMLESISDAIRGAGESLRGKNNAEQTASGENSEDYKTGSEAEDIARSASAKMIDAAPSRKNKGQS